MSYDSLRLHGIDHIELAVGDLDRATDVFLRLGFLKAGVRSILERGLKSHLLVQDGVSLVLSHSKQTGDPIAAFVKAHGDGVENVVFRCEDAVSALELVAGRGAQVTDPPKAYKRDFGTVQQASFRAFGDVRHSFLSRKGSLFAEGFEQPQRNFGKGCGISRFDHFAAVVESGQLEPTVDFYERVLGLSVQAAEEAEAAVPGVRTRAVESPDGQVRIPLSEPLTDDSPACDFLHVSHGPGIHHLALDTESLISTVGHLKRQGIPFLTVAAPYYEALSQRFAADLSADTLKRLEELGILLDGGDGKLLFQIYTPPVLGPLFLEFTQRQGHPGYGEGNIAALLKAQEKDRARLGVIRDETRPDGNSL